MVVWLETVTADFVFATDFSPEHESKYIEDYWRDFPLKKIK